LRLVPVDQPVRSWLAQFDQGAGQQRFGVAGDGGEQVGGDAPGGAAGGAGAG
jgi:hypothetical protein